MDVVRYADSPDPYSREPYYGRYYTSTSYFPSAGAPPSGQSMMNSHPKPPHEPECPPGERQRYGKQPAQVQCQNCGYNIITTTQPAVGGCTWLSGAAIALVGGFLGCCLIPCCLKSCKDVVHTCPKCDHIVGRYNRLNKDEASKRHASKRQSREREHESWRRQRQARRRQRQASMQEAREREHESWRRQRQASMQEAGEQKAMEKAANKGKRGSLWKNGKLKRGIWKKRGSAAVNPTGVKS